jgi:hypothetical protein
MKYYSGIGSRETPEDILNIMSKIAIFLSKQNFLLRSGGADGADSAFESGCDKVRGKKEIYLPWKNFNKNPSKDYYVSAAALSLAEKYHPTWASLSHGARLLHGRNCYQVLGLELNTPSSFIICWHKGFGGTMQAVRLAKSYRVPVYNLFVKKERKKLHNFLMSL